MKCSICLVSILPLPLNIKKKVTNCMYHIILHFYCLISRYLTGRNIKARSSRKEDDGDDDFTDEDNHNTCNDEDDSDSDQKKKKRGNVISCGI